MYKNVNLDPKWKVANDFLKSNAEAFGLIVTLLNPTSRSVALHTHTLASIVLDKYSWHVDLEKKMDTNKDINSLFSVCVLT